MSFDVEIGHASQRGPRDLNEDFAGAVRGEGADRARGLIAAVADGVSSGGFGLEASQTTVMALLNDFFGTPAHWEPTVALDRLIAAQNAWLADHNPGLPASSTDDDYWRGQAAWHQSLFEAGFFGMTWPEEIGGQALGSTFDVIVDDELALAGTPPRPSLGYLVQGILEHGSAEVQQRFLPGIVNGRER